MLFIFVCGPLKKTIWIKIFSLAQISENENEFENFLVISLAALAVKYKNKSQWLNECNKGAKSDGCLAAALSLNVVTWHNFVYVVIGVCLMTLL